MRDFSMQKIVCLDRTCKAEFSEFTYSNKFVFRVELKASHENCITSTSSLRHSAINSQIARSTSHPMLFYVPSEFEIKYLLINTFVFMYRMHLTN